MNFTNTSQLSLIGFVVINVFVFFSLVMGVWISQRTKGQSASAGKRAALFGIGFAIYLFIFSQLVQSGWLEDSPFPRVMIAFGLVNLISIVCAFSKVGGWLATGVPLAALVAFQGFRFPLELVLHEWAAQGVIPETMTWTGSNFDIISGLVAIVAAFFVKKNRAFAWVANLIGFALLINVMRVAVMSSPLPFAWQVNPPLQLAFHLPYALIVPVCVGGALFGHIVLTRALLSSKNR
jgi:hypothetical protein